MKVNSNNINTFLPMDYEPTIPIINLATVFEEMSDVLDLAEHLNTKERIREIWNLKNDWIKSDIGEIQTLYLVRTLLQPSELGFVDIVRRLRLWDLYDNSWHRIIAPQSGSWIQLLQAKVRFDRNIQTDLSEFRVIVQQTENTDPHLFVNTVCSACARSPVPDPYFLEKLVIAHKLFPENKRAWKHWTLGNLVLFSTTQDPEYAIRAMHGFAGMLKQSSLSLYHLCQMCSLCFLSNIDMTSVFKHLSARSIEPIVEQLLAQFEHENESIRTNVIEIVQQFASRHIQAIAFPIGFMIRECSAIGRACPNLRKLAESLSFAHASLWHEIQSVTDGLINVGFTRKEQMKGLIKDAYEIYDVTGSFPQLIEKLRKVFEIARCPDDTDVFTHRRRELTGYDAVKRAIEEGSQALVSYRVRRFFRDFGKEVEDEFSLRRSLDIFTLSESLSKCEPNVIAMPGFYDVDNPYPRVFQFFPIAKIIPSLQRPRKIRVLSGTGVVYRYLLKGGEDLRLSQRVMQWFSLASSILSGDKSGLEKNLHIQGYPIIPLSPRPA
jgi:hypothetical protein